MDFNVTLFLITSLEHYSWTLLPDVFHSHSFMLLVLSHLGIRPLPLLKSQFPHYYKMDKTNSVASPKELLLQTLAPRQASHSTERAI